MLHELRGLSQARWSPGLGLRPLHGTLGQSCGRWPSGWCHGVWESHPQERVAAWRFRWVGRRTVSTRTEMRGPSRKRTWWWTWAPQRVPGQRKGFHFFFMIANSSCSLSLTSPTHFIHSFQHPKPYHGNIFVFLLNTRLTEVFCFRHKIKWKKKQMTNSLTFKSTVRKYKGTKLTSKWYYRPFAGIWKYSFLTHNPLHLTNIISHKALGCRCCPLRELKLSNNMKIRNKGVQGYYF